MKYSARGFAAWVLQVAPPRGERGLKFSLLWGGIAAPCRRSPSWGAWIEICRFLLSFYKIERRSPSWGAWIEIHDAREIACDNRVAPPRGERGLKYILSPPRRPLVVSLPLRGAWIEITDCPDIVCAACCRSPSWGAWSETSGSQWSSYITPKDTIYRYIYWGSCL